MKQVLNIENLLYLGNRKQVTGNSSAFKSWFQEQLGNCFHNVLSVWKMGVCYVQMKIQNKISWSAVNQSISHLPFVRISRCATMVRCTWRKIANAWFFSSYKRNLSPCPRNLSFPAKSLRIKVLLMEAHCILWPVNPMAWRVHIYLDQMSWYWYNKIIFVDLSATQSEVWLIKLEITIFSWDCLGLSNRLTFWNACIAYVNPALWCLQNYS